MRAFPRLIFLTSFTLLVAPLEPKSANAGAATSRQAEAAIAWQPWSDAAFAQAKKEHKFVLMDLEAVWCHWCHVEDEVTYRDPEVIRLIRERYIAVKVDQDSRPDISNRYEDYGWPATVVFNADGGEIVKRSGYIPPVPMARMLQAIIDDPTPGPSVRAEKSVTFSQQSSLTPALKQTLEDRLAKAYDAKLGGWGTVHKFIDWDALEYSMARGRQGDAEAASRARQTLSAGLKLIDPAWGGVYQYSIDGDWDHPHFEKLMQFQAEVMRIYALAWANFHDPAYLKAAQAIHSYMSAFLRSPEGAFYVSQDADLQDGQYAEKYFAMDDAGRRHEGVPRIDIHVYARENGWAIRGLVGDCEWTGDKSSLADAIRAAQWVMAHRALPDGGFSHGEHDPAGPYLADTLAMGQAFLALYEATADRTWLEKAESAAQFIAGHSGPVDSAGFATAAQSDEPDYRPRPQVDENVTAARFFNLLFRYTGKKQVQAMSQRAMRFLATPQVADGRGFFVAGILLADIEVNSEPLHVTVLGPYYNAIARNLFVQALCAPTAYKRIDWWDPAAGPLANSDVEYPKLPYPAALLCSNGTCSLPVRTPEGLAAKLGENLRDLAAKTK